MGAAGVSFKKFSTGDYTFKLKPNLQIQLWRILPYTRLKVLKPWYRANIAVFIYLILFLL
jgi:hypothetical protein